MYPLKLKPIYDKTIWANDQLTTLRGIDEKGLGTCWEVSAHPYATNIILNGEFAGSSLDEVINKFPKEMLGTKQRREMLRLAFLDAKDDLSIQVHPQDDYAHKYENDEGKTESWYILKADEGATLVAGTSVCDPAVVRKAVSDNEVEAYVKKIPVKAGDFVCIDAGMLHALGKGILALEIGQNSNTTYRFYDYKRVDKNGNERELHIEKSFDVTDFSLTCIPVHSPLSESRGEKQLVDRKEFSVELIDIDGEFAVPLDGERFFCVSNVEKDAKVYFDGEQMPFQYTESIFVPAACKSVSIKGNTRILLSYVR